MAHPLMPASSMKSASHTDSTDIGNKSWAAGPDALTFSTAASSSFSLNLPNFVWRQLTLATSHFPISFKVSPLPTSMV